MIATGVTSAGDREVLGIEVGDSEDGAFWTAFLRSLRARGLSGVKLVISDHHLGLKAAISSVFIGAGWQRCRVHFMRNVLSKVPKASAEMVAAAIRTIFAQPDPEHVRAQATEIARMLATKFPEVSDMLTDANEDLLAFTTFPQAHWRKIWSTNPLERLNGEIKRRTNVVGIFPNDASVLRLVTAVIVETHDEWQVAERRYLSEESMAKLYATDNTETRPGFGATLPGGCRRQRQSPTRLRGSQSVSGQHYPVDARPNLAGSVRPDPRPYRVRVRRARRCSRRLASRRRSRTSPMVRSRLISSRNGRCS